jgi:hypothetical protein
MKNLVYAGVIGACILVAVVVVVKSRSSGPGINDLSDTEMTWVKCMKCNQSYEMRLKDFYTQQDEMARANPSPMMVARPLKCEKCGQEAIARAFKCEQCGEVSRLNSVPADFEDRCPKCKYSKTEASRKARLQQQQQQ